MVLNRINSRTPPGVRGLKLKDYLKSSNLTGRTPPGVRGLKLLLLQYFLVASRSHPTRGAWIETKGLLKVMQDSGSHPTRGAWIETRPFAWA